MSQNPARGSKDEKTHTAIQLLYISHTDTHALLNSTNNTHTHTQMWTNKTAKGLNY